MRQLHFYLGLVFSFLSFSSLAQMEERAMTRKANTSYQDSLFTKATLEYKQALEIHDFDTNRFNMAVSLFAEENTEEAIKEGFENLYSKVKPFTSSPLSFIESSIGLGIASCMATGCDIVVVNMKKVIKRKAKSTIGVKSTFVDIFFAFSLLS